MEMYTLVLSNSSIALSRVIFWLFVSKIGFELLPPVKSPTPHKANPQTSKTRKILKKLTEFDFLGLLTFYT